jgi:cobalamin biosynthesis protein CobT
MNREIIELRQVVQKLVPLIAGRGLKVTQRGSQAYVLADAKTNKPYQVNIPNIPDTATPEFVLAVHGFIDHEVAHVLVTDWSYYGGEPGSKNTSVFVNMHNIIEDTMIEREMIKLFPGSRKNLSNVRKHFLIKITAEAMKSVSSDKEAFNYLLVPFMRALAGHDEMIEFMDDNKHWDSPLIKKLHDLLPAEFLSNIKSCTSTKETLVLTQTAMDILLNAMTPPPPPPAPPEEEEEKDGESQDKPEDKAGEGDGDGERDHSEQEESEEEADSEDGGGKADKSDEEDAEETEAEAENDDTDADGEDADGDADADTDEGEDESASSGASSDDDEDEDGVGAEAEGDDDGQTSEGQDDEGDTQSSGGDADDADEETDGVGASAGSDPDNAGEHIGDNEDDSGEGGGGVGSTQGESIFDMQDDDLDDKDLSSAISDLISREAVLAMDMSDYTVFTREFDKVQPYEVPANMNDKLIAEIDDEVQRMIAPMQKDIERIMASRSHVIRTPGHRSGKLHAPSLYRVSQGDPRVFSQKQEHTSKDTAVSLLIDNSGSMMGEKCTLSMTAGYALASTLERVKIANEVLGFTTGNYYSVPDTLYKAMQEDYKKSGIEYDRSLPLEIPIYKSFEERMATAPIKRRFAHMRKYQGGMSGNIDGESIQIAAERLLRRTEKRKVMIVMSDGRPAGANRCEEHLSTVIASLTKIGVECIGIGIQDSNVRRFYPRYTVLNDLQSLPGQVMKELKQLLTA